MSFYEESSDRWGVETFFSAAIVLWYAGAGNFKDAFEVVIINLLTWLWLYGCVQSEKNHK